MRKDTITMSMNEMKRLHLVQKTEEKLLTQQQAAQMLNLSDRHFRRIIARFRSEGAKGLVHKLRDKPSHRKFDPSFSDRIVCFNKLWITWYRFPIRDGRVVNEKTTGTLPSLSIASKSSSSLGL